MQEHQPAARLAERFGANPAELAGLALLVVAGFVVVVVLWWWQRPAVVPAAGPEGTTAADGAPLLAAAEVLVHVTGEVRRPGVVRVRDGARVVDVVELAGGATVAADLGALNLARLVVDGEQVVVPAVRSGDGGDGGGGATAGPWDAEGRLDLNRATAGDLEQLPGIGPVMAQRILRHREEHGRFASVGDLRAVPGIGEKTFQSLAPLVFV